MFYLVSCGSFWSWVWSSLLVTALTQMLFFLVSATFQFDKLTDMAGCLNFLVLSMTGLLGCHRNSQSGYPIRTLILTIMILLWSARLGIFLFTRVWIRKKDNRFDSIRGNFFKFLMFWVLQIGWIWTVSLPLTLVNASATLINGPFGGINIWDLMGWTLWISGFLIESVADHQKHLFNSTPKHERTLPFITSGLWKYSRHPNYFGEILLWTGIWLSAAQCLRQFSLVAVLFAALSPILTFHLLVRVSGIPLAEAKDDKKYNRLLAYQQYKAITSPLLPISPHFYALIHPKIKKSFLLERNPGNPATFPMPKMKPGSPIQYSSQISR